MAYNSELERVLDAETSGWEGLAKKPMFGGLGYLLHGNMCVGIWRDQLIGRVGDEAHVLKRIASVSDMDITGRPMTGWVKVSPEGWQDEKTRRTILDASLAWVRTLPKKPQ